MKCLMVLQICGFYEVFDGSTDTYWRSTDESGYDSLTVSFKRTIIFEGVRITVFRANHERYRNVCVFIDKTKTNTGDEEACTDSNLEVTDGQVVTLTPQSPKETAEVYIRFNYTQILTYVISTNNMYKSHFEGV